MALNKLYKIVTILLFCVVQLAAQQNTVQCINPRFDKTVNFYLSHTVPTISVADAWEQKEHFVFLDAREEKEYAISHIPDATYVGYDDFDLKSLADIDKESPIIVYCSIGYRSEKIGEKLKDAGFQNVLNLYGSIFEWVNQHHPVEDLNGHKTLKVHSYNENWSKWIQAGEIEKVYK